MLKKLEQFFSSPSDETGLKAAFCLIGSLIAAFLTRAESPANAPEAIHPSQPSTDGEMSLLGQRRARQAHSSETCQAAPPGGGGPAFPEKPVLAPLPHPSSPRGGGVPGWLPSLDWPGFAQFWPRLNFPVLVGLLAYFRPLESSYSLAKWGALACAVLPAVARRPLGRTKADAPFLAYLAVCAFSCLWAVELPISVYGYYGTHNAALCQLALIWAVYALAAAEEDASGLWNAVIVAALVNAALAWWGKMGLTALGAASETYRPYALLGSPVYLGAFLGLGVVVAAARAPWAVLPIGSALLLTQGRAGLAGAVVGIAVLYRHRLPARGSWAALLGFPVLLLAAAAGATWLASQGSRGDLWASDSGRVLVWQAALRSIAEHPLGTGPESFGWAAWRYRTTSWDLLYGPTTQDHAHNFLLNELVNTGWLGFVPLVWLLAVWARALRDSRDPLALPAVASLLPAFLSSPVPLPLLAVTAAILGHASRASARAFGFRAPLLGAVLLSLLGFARCVGYDRDIRLFHRVVAGERAIAAFDALQILRRRVPEPEGPRAK